MKRIIIVILGVVIVLVAIGIVGIALLSQKMSSYDQPLPVNVTGYNIEYDSEKEEFNVTLALIVENPYDFPVKDVLIKSDITGTGNFHKSWKIQHFPKEVTSDEIAPINYSTQIDFEPKNINVYVYAQKPS